MLLFVTLAFLVLTIVLTYRHLRHVSTRFLYGIIAGWIASLSGFVFYVSDHAYYFNILTRLFMLNRAVWRIIILADVSADTAIRLINIGIWVFAVSLAGFTLSITDFRANTTGRRALYGLLLLVPIIDLVYHDPGTYRAFKSAVFGAPRGSYLSLFDSPLADRLTLLLFWLRVTYLAAPLVLLWTHVLFRPRLSFIRRYALFQTISLTSITVTHATLFSWAPTILVKGTLIKGYFFYRTPDFDNMALSLRVFPFVILGVLTLLVFLIFRYNAAEAYNRDFDVHIRRSIDTANLGVRAFTHSIKNYVLGIQEESRRVRERYPDDAATVESVDLIDRYCQASLSAFDHAASRLGSLVLDLHPASLQRIAERAVEATRPPRSQPVVTVHTDPNPPFCYGDEKRLSEAIGCLIANALEAIDGTGGNVDVRVFRENAWGVVEIADDGPGIAPRDLQSVFTPFFSTKASTSNWGIGLSYCHRIVSAHDGSLSVSSRPGAGATFRIALPLV